MQEQLISAHIGSEGDVIAITKKACYSYKKKLSEDQRKKLMQALTVKQEIDTEHWEIEWEFTGVSLDQVNSSHTPK